MQKQVSLVSAYASAKSLLWLSGLPVQAVRKQMAVLQAAETTSLTRNHQGGQIDKRVNSRFVRKLDERNLTLRSGL